MILNNIKSIKKAKTNWNGILSNKKKQLMNRSKIKIFTINMKKENLTKIK